MKNRELFVLRHGLQQVQNFPGVKFAIMVAKNLKRINEEIAILDESQKPSPAFIEYDMKRLELARELADKDVNGDPLVEKSPMGDQLVLKENKVEFSTRWEALKEEYADALEVRRLQMTEYQELLDEESSVELVTISEDYLPEEITAAQLSLIMGVISDPTVVVSI